MKQISRYYDCVASLSSLLDRATSMMATGGNEDLIVVISTNEYNKIKRNNINMFILLMFKSAKICHQNRFFSLQSLFDQSKRLPMLYLTILSEKMILLLKNGSLISTQSFPCNFVRILSR